MVKKSSNKKSEEIREEQKETVENKGQSEQVNETEKPVKKKSARKTKATKEKELLEKIDEINDKYIRIYSEFDNYRRRTAKEKIELNKSASEDVIVDLLPVLDDFERAINSTADSDDCDAVKDGVNLIFNKFKGVLEKRGLKPIESKGEEFDTDFHEAITQIPAPSKDMKGKVVDETEKGYMLNDKVIRFSKVVIGS